MLQPFGEIFQILRGFEDGPEVPKHVRPYK
jgi:hypothetical protein